MVAIYLGISEHISRQALYIIGCGCVGGLIRYLKHVPEHGKFDRAKLLAGQMSSCLCSLGGFAVGEMTSLPFAATCFLMILLAFFDGRLLEALDKSLVTIIEDGASAFVRRFLAKETEKKE